MQKILFLDHTPFIGGAQLSLLQHLKYVDKNAFQVHLGCSSQAERTGLSSLYQKNGIKYTILPFAKLKLWSPVALFRLFKSVKAVCYLIREQECELVVTNTVRAAIVGTWAARREKKKVVWLIRDFTFPQSLFKYLSPYPSKVVFNSKAVREYYQYLLNDTSREEVVYPGREFLQEKKETGFLREEWGISNKEYVIGCTSRLVRWKGVEVLLRAVREMVSKGKNNFRCVIMGTGGGQKESNEEDLQKKVKKWGIEEYVVFTGYKENVVEYLHNFNIFVFPSIESEPFGASIVDAMMAGVPVVASRTGGVPEIIKSEETGLLVEPGDHKQLEGSLTKLLENEQWRKDLGENGYRYAMDNFHVKTTTEQLEEVYRRVLEE